MPKPSALPISMPPPEQTARPRTARGDRPTTKRATQADRTQKARARILEAAFACLAQDGYQHTTLIEIAKRAGCSRELPRYHFGTKDRLMEALVHETQTHWREVFREEQNSDMTALEALCMTADCIAKEIRENPVTVRGFMVLVFCAADPANKILHGQITANQRRTRGYFKAMIVKHVNTNPGLEALDAEAVAAAIYSFFRGVGYQWLIDPDGVSVDGVVAEFKRLCPSLLRLPAEPSSIDVP